MQGAIPSRPHTSSRHGAKLSTGTIYSILDSPFTGSKYKHLLLKQKQQWKCNQCGTGSAVIIVICVYKPNTILILRIISRHVPLTVNT